MSKYPKDLLKLFSYLRKLPGVGFKTAERFAFHLIDWKEEDLHQLSLLLASVKNNLSRCPECGCLKEDLCSFCDNPVRDSSILCVVGSFKDVYVIEDTKMHNGLYHVMNVLLSPLEGKESKHLKVDELKKRVEKYKIKEIILALDATLEGDATALYIKKELAYFDISITRLAFGLPLGSSLDFIDGGTLQRALTDRQLFK